MDEAEPFASGVYPQKLARAYLGFAMLYGRGKECARIRLVLAAARKSHGRGLVIRGDPGIGKSALLGYGAGRARAMGMRVAAARGAEDERELAFAGLHEVLRPVLPSLTQLPTRQCRVLRGALAIGPPVGADRLAVGVATLSLLAMAAEEVPMLIVVDDAQWLDHSSREALVFAARRLTRDRVAFLWAVRDNEAASVGFPGEQLSLAALTADAVLDLLAAIGQPNARNTYDVVTAAQGNPLAAIELSRAGSASDNWEPGPVSPSVESLFARTAERLPSNAQQAVIVAAAAGDGPLDVVIDACTTLGVDGGLLEIAEDLGLVHLGPNSVTFHHPLARRAIYQWAPASSRRAAHAAVAESLGRRGDVEQRAWHAAAAATVPSEAVAGELESASTKSAARGAHTAAASALARAAALTADAEEKARRLLGAGRHAWAGGRAQRALELLEAAVSETHEPGRRADAILLKGEILTHQHSARASYELCVHEAENVVATDRRRAVLLLASAAGVGAFFGSVPLSLSAARRASEIALRDGAEQEFCSSFILGRTLTLAGEPGGAALLRRAADIASQGTLDLPPEIASWAGTNWMHHKSGLQILHRLIADARDKGAVGNLPFLLRQLGAHERVDSHYKEAFAAAVEGLELARDCGEYSQELHLLVLLVELTADEGQELECRAYAEDAYALAGRLGLAWRRAAVTLALGGLELGLGRASAAVELLEEGVRDLNSQGFNGTSWYPAVDLTEAYLRVRQHEHAVGVVSELRRRRRRAAGSKTGAEAHCRGLVSDDQSFEPFLLNAIGQTDGEPFWQARAQLTLGARLRRSRRRLDARKSLRAAHATFERIGARAWAEQARNELAATGETARRRIPGSADELTSQEFRVAIEVANGGTNRAVGAHLFISPKTVEHHLAQVYRKLAIGSRDELRSQLMESHQMH